MKSLAQGRKESWEKKILRQGDRWRPKDTPMLVLIASILDPRMKSGIGFSPLDREQIWSEIQNTLVLMALEDDDQV
jgi:hypothetical protein